MMYHIIEKIIRFNSFPFEISYNNLVTNIQPITILYNRIHIQIQIFFDLKAV